MKSIRHSQHFLTQDLLTISQGTKRFEALAVIVMVLMFTAFPLLPYSSVIGIGICIVLVTVVSWFKRWSIGVSVGMFCMVCIALVLLKVPFSQLWLSLALSIQVLVIRVVPWLRGNDAWLRVGSLGKDMWLLTAISGLMAAIALIAWFLLLQPNIDDLIESLLPDLNLGLLIVAALLFSIVNAAVEEGAYRGVIMDALDRSLGAGIAALIIQAVAFGTFHIRGFPRGWLGVGLACIYGLMMGIIRRRTEGMLAPWIAHVFIDVVIMGIVILSLGSGLL